MIIREESEPQVRLKTIVDDLIKQAATLAVVLLDAW